MKIHNLITITILFIVGIGIGYIAGYITPRAPTQIVSAPTSPLNGTVLLIGVIHSNPVYVNSEEAAAQIAKEEIEEWLRSLGINMSIQLLFENAEGSATKALEKLQSLAARGVHFVLGFRWSSHVKACLDFANKNKILIISDASTSPALSIPNRGYLIRMPVDDTYQGKAIARMIIDYGVKYVAVLQRADAWGDGLYESFAKRFSELGGNIIARVRYDPEKTDFTPEIKLLDDTFRDAINKYGKDKVGLLLLAFEDDSVAIQATAASYPNIMSVVWFGSDGHVRAERLVTEQGSNALKVKHISTYMGVSESELWRNFAEKYKKIVGTYPGTYDTLLYDSMWLLVKTIVEVQSTDVDKVYKAIFSVAERSFGASGWLALNEYGDRKEAYYDIWAVVEKGEVPRPGEIGWKKVGIYDPISDKITWFERV